MRQGILPATDSIVAAIRGVEAGSYQELVIP
jgi:hypothetical protein